MRTTSIRDTQMPTMPTMPTNTSHDSSGVARPLLIDVVRHRAAPLRLFCFPPAGLGPSFYFRWADLVPPTVDLFTFHLPGRENHPSHLSTTDPRRLVRELTDLIPAENPGGFGFFGHSIGALLAFETVRQLRRNQAPTPDLLAVSGLPAPHLDRLRANIIDTMFEGLGGRHDLLKLLPDDPGGDTEKKTLYYAPVAADSLLILHHHHYEEAPLDSALSIYGGRSDPFTSMEALTAWNDLVTLPATPQLYPGRHVYLAEQFPAVVEQLVRDLNVAVRTVRK
jgi:surfactin synthase thioesterase subunit